jgi:hypothetical protein
VHANTKTPTNQQAAVAPASLPLGPSTFELRVWALLTRTSVHVLSSHRAKTAGPGGGPLMNKRQQEVDGDYGRWYFKVAALRETNPVFCWEHAGNR